jgi:pimeloyl-ACP methyl ester carboxylesterase
MKMKMVQRHLVLLPGLDGTGSLFAPFVNHPANPFTTSVVSFPRDRALNYPQLFPSIREAIPWGKPYTLVAESFSGPLALLFAADQRADIEAIVLVASFVTNPLGPLFEWGRFLVKDSWLQKMPPSFMLKKYLLGEDCPPVLVDELEQAIRSVTPEVRAHRVHMVLNTDARTALKACEKPILYLQGTQDKLVGARGLAAITAVKPNVASAVIDAPHLLLQRKPREALEAIENFLQTLKS